MWDLFIYKFTYTTCCGCGSKIYKQKKKKESFKNLSAIVERQLSFQQSIVKWISICNTNKLLELLILFIVKILQRVKPGQG